jgi:hypothetical protein
VSWSSRIFIDGRGDPVRSRAIHPQDRHRTPLRLLPPQKAREDHGIWNHQYPRGEDYRILHVPLQVVHLGLKRPSMEGRFLFVKPASEEAFRNTGELAGRKSVRGAEATAAVRSGLLSFGATRVLLSGTLRENPRRSAASFWTSLWRRAGREPSAIREDAGEFWKEWCCKRGLKSLSGASTH